MRLSPEQIHDIVSVISSYVTPPYELYLVGSRTTDSKKGGDIDLLLLCEPKSANHIKRQKHKVIDQIKSQSTIDETRTDLIIGEQSSLKNDPFISTLTDRVLLDKR